MDLASIWFFLWGVLWAVYFALDGFDLGIGMLGPFVAKSEEEKHTIAAVIGPIWDGNEVWLVAAGGVTFAAFPRVYAVMFSALYLPLLLILFALIVRAASLEFRFQYESKAWQRFWGAGLALGSFFPAFLFGVAFANIFQGIPIDANGVFHGGLLTLLSPYCLLGGSLFVLLFVLHGALFLAIRTQGALQEKCLAVARGFWLVSVCAAACFFGASAFATDLYSNYNAFPGLYAIPALAVAGLLGVRLNLARKTLRSAWIASAAGIMAAVFFGLAGLFPRMLPSSLDPGATLTVWNAASSPLTLKIMMGVVLVFLPVIIAYQAWAYRLFSGPVTKEDLSY